MEPTDAVVVPGRRLGKLAPKFDPRTLRLARYVQKRKLPKIPQTHILSKRTRAAFPHLGMMRNDTLGDCTCAALGHSFQAWSVYGGKPWRPTDQEIVQAYDRVNGGVDEGAFMLDVLNLARREGIGGNRIYAFVSIDPQDHDQVRTAHFLFGGLYFGAGLPVTAQDQQVWDVSSAAGSEPGSWGGHCPTPDTKVLTADLQWREIGSLKTGDALTGFDESVPPDWKRRQYRTAVVEGIEEMQLPCYEVTFADGTEVTCSADHMWLVGNAGDTHHWIRTDRLMTGPERASNVLKPLDVWAEDTSRDGGYLAAAFDGEGWLDGESARAIHKAGFSQKPNEMLDRVRIALAERGYHTTERVTTTSGYVAEGGPFHQVLLNTSKANLARFLGSVRPHRLLSKFTPDRFGSCQGNHARVVKKVACGPRTVIAMRTSTGTFLAAGMASHNCMNVYDTGKKELQVATWGELQRLTWAWWDRYVDEAYVILEEDYVGSNKRSPQGISLAALAEDLGAL